MSAAIWLVAAGAWIAVAVPAGFVLGAAIAAADRCQRHVTPVDEATLADLAADGIDGQFWSIIGREFHEVRP